MTNLTAAQKKALANIKALDAVRVDGEKTILPSMVGCRLSTLIALEAAGFLISTTIPASHTVRASYGWRTVDCSYKLFRLA